jgi:hypothetical protein
MNLLRLVYSFIAVAWADWVSPLTTPTLEKGSTAATTTVSELGTATSGIRSSSSSNSSLLRGAAASGADIADIKDNGIGFVKVHLVTQGTF